MGGGGGFRIDEEHDQNRMLAKQACVDRISKDEVANTLLSFNRKNRLNKMHLMMKKNKVVVMKERIRVTKMTKLKLM